MARQAKRVGCRDQIGLVQQDLTRVYNDLTTALAQAHAQVANLDNRLKASVAAEREASARFNQQATSLVDLSVRLEQQLDSSRANDERISQSLRQRQWTEAQTATLLFPIQSLMSPSVGSTSSSGDRGAGGIPAANRGSLAMSL